MVLTFEGIPTNLNRASTKTNTFQGGVQDNCPQGKILA